MGNINIVPYFFGLTLLMHFFFAMGVFVAARGLRARGEKVMFAPPVVWAFHTLLWGMIVVLSYWLIHHSSLRATKQGQ